MRKRFSFLFLFFFMCGAYADDAYDLEVALQNTYRACVGIDESLHDIKVLAGINTAVTGVGTGLGVGAVATGFVKQNTDNKLEELEPLLHEMEDLSGRYTGEEPGAEDIARFLEEEYNKSYDVAINESVKKEQDKLTQKSKRLGNWRTGLMAGNTATNIAGAIIASKTINKDGIQGQIETCINATKELNSAIIAAKMSGEDISEAQQIYNACREYEYVDISPINTRGKGAMMASSVGAGLGGAGTVTSAIANSNKSRNDNTEKGKQKEKNLNTASNVLAIGATAASATATVFNATQIAAIKKVSKVAESCTGVLK